MDSTSKRATLKNSGYHNRSFESYMPASKIHIFETLYKSLLKHYGSAFSVEKALNAGNGTMKIIFTERKLSEHYAKKILNEFNRLKSLKANK